MSVTVYDHMPSAGRKFLLAGRSGLNLTHSESIDRLLDRYGTAGNDLESAIRSFTPDDLRQWCLGLGESTFIGTSGRVFPSSFRATPLLRAWLLRLAGLGVRFEQRHRWVGWTQHPSGSRFSRPDGSPLDVVSDVTLLALGGASWPRVGSDGGWAEQFRRAGIVVNPLRPANCGVMIDWSAVFRDRFEGTPLKNVAVRVGATTIRGEPVVTRSGLEGGPIYAHSRAVRAAIDGAGTCRLLIDLQPDLTVEQLTDRLANRRRKESLSTSLKRLTGLQPVAIALLRETAPEDVPSEPHALAMLLKATPVTVIETMPIDRAISTAGGVEFSEIDETFMLRKRPGTFVAGEMLDWEAPTGGYLLQACFSTGVAAARGALARSV
jgi:uncharacterized flavoprotein (TIGR03862 family)